LAIFFFNFFFSIYTDICIFLNSKIGLKLFALFFCFIGQKTSFLATFAPAENSFFS